MATVPKRHALRIARDELHLIVPVRVLLAHFLESQAVEFFRVGENLRVHGYAIVGDFAADFKLARRNAQNV